MLPPFSQRPTSRRSGNIGFTLVELQVALVILLMLMVLLTGILGNVSSVWTGASERMDNFAKGRALLSSIDRDLRAAVIRPDLVVFPGTPAPTFSFYSRQFGQDAFSPTARPLSFITYQLVVRDDEWMLQRSDQPQVFADADAPPWQLPPAAPTAPPPSDAPVERPLCSGVYAFAYAFIHADGTVSPNFQHPGQFPGNPTRAVQFAVAVANEKAVKILRELNLESALSSKLRDEVASSPASAKAAWDRLLALPETQAEFPPAVLSGIRTYERVTPLELSFPSPVL